MTDSPDPLLTTSAGHIFQLFRQGRVRTRRELMLLTGLSRSTVMQRVGALLTAGYLREGGTEASTGGRPPTALTPNDAAKTILAADLGATHGRLAVLDGAGQTLADKTIESRIATGPDAVLEFVCSALASLLEDSGRDPAQVCGVGVGLPGPVDGIAGRPVQPPIMPGWDDYPVREAVGRHFRAPVFVENDANLMALGEAALCYPDIHSLLFVKVATGIGAGLVIGGRVYNGVDGGAGDIGHVRVPAAEEHRCSCGADGCLAAVASGAAIARELKDRGWPTETSRDVVRLVQEGNGDAVKATRQSGRLLGKVLATAVSLLNPGALILGGDMAFTHEHFLAGLRESLYQRTQPLATRSLHISTSRLGDHAGVAGAAVMVRETVFSATAIDRALADDAADADPDMPPLLRL
ncbi:MAG TPA: ROK family protein [Streptosporangiaceae bacterium]|nr:ROK family protein [Streptosporangiaceae bacterium]